MQQLIQKWESRALAQAEKQQRERALSGRSRSKAKQKEQLTELPQEVETSKGTVYFTVAVIPEETVIEQETRIYDIKEEICRKADLELVAELSAPILSRQSFVGMPVASSVSDPSPASPPAASTFTTATAPTPSFATLRPDADATALSFPL